MATAGSVDDGKSTLIGRLLYESQAIYEDQLASIRQASARAGAPGGLDLALVTDGLKAEREQGITIDVAYRYFSTPRRKFILADTPGHEQYTPNMVTGCSRANLVVLLIDATRGLTTQTRRHAFLAALLGVRHLAVTVNKMDAVGYAQDAFEAIRAGFADFAAKLEVSDLTFIPISALHGDNVVTASPRMPWYPGPPLLRHLETVHIAGDRNLIDLRFPVQHVQRALDGARWELGTVASGVIRPGEEVLVLPSGARGRVAEVRGPDGAIEEGFPPLSVAVRLTEAIDVARGDMLVHVRNVPRVERALDAMFVWMAREPLEPGRQYVVQHGARQVPGSFKAVHYRLDVDTLHRRPAETLRLNEIGRCSLELGGLLAFDPYVRNRSTGALLVIDRESNRTVAVGMILDRRPDELAPSLDQRPARQADAHLHRRQGLLSMEQRAARYGQQPATVWLTGLSRSGKTTLAYALERRLFDLGRVCAVLDGENFRLGLSSDLGFAADDRSENVRRAAEAARLLNQSGIIVICAFVSPSRADRRRARQIVSAERFVEVYLSAPVDVCRQRDPEHLYDQAQAGEIHPFTGVSAPYEPPESPELELPTHSLPVDACVERMLELLRAKGFIR